MSKKYAIALLMIFSACSFQKIKKSPELPKLDQESFSYHQAIQKEKMLLARAETVKFTSETNSQ